MRPLSAAELIDVWERGMTRSSWQQALLLLSVACPEMTPDALAQASIGHRDTLLLQLRAWTFGPHLDSVVDCPACSERLEFSLDSSEFLSSGLETPQTPQQIDADGFASWYVHRTASIWLPSTGNGPRFR